MGMQHPAAWRLFLLFLWIIGFQAKADSSTLASAPLKPFATFRTNGYCNGRELHTGLKYVSREVCRAYCQSQCYDYTEYNPKAAFYNSTAVGGGCWCHDACNGINIYNN